MSKTKDEEEIFVEEAVGEFLATAEKFPSYELEHRIYLGIAWGMSRLAENTGLMRICRDRLIDSGISPCEAREFQKRGYGIIETVIDDLLKVSSRRINGRHD